MDRKKKARHIKRRALLFKAKCVQLSLPGFRQRAEAIRLRDRQLIRFWQRAIAFEDEFEFAIFQLSQQFILFFAGAQLAVLIGMEAGCRPG